MRLVIAQFLLITQVFAAQKNSIGKSFVTLKCLKLWTPGPPKLLEQSGEEVWYHLDDEDLLKNRLTLRCEADENTDRWVEIWDWQVLRKTCKPT